MSISFVVCYREVIIINTRAVHNLVLTGNASAYQKIWTDCFYTREYRMSCDQFLVSTRITKPKILKSCVIEKCFLWTSALRYLANTRWLSCDILKQPLGEAPLELLAILKLMKCCEQCMVGRLWPLRVSNQNFRAIESSWKKSFLLNYQH